MKTLTLLWITVLFDICSTKDNTPLEGSNADVALLRNVLSSVPNRHPLYYTLLSPSLTSSYRLREVARWLNQYPYWQHLPRTDIIALVNWHSGHSGHQQVLFKPPSYLSHTAKPPTYLGAYPHFLGVKPTASFARPPWIPAVKPTKKTEVEIKPLSFASWYNLWKDEEVGECGIPDVETNIRTSRIVGGSVAKPGSWPWMVSLLLKPIRQHFCAGVLIAPQWVLTAPHCFELFPGLKEKSKWLVRLGKFNISSGVFEKYREQDYNITKLVFHPDFKTHKVYKPELNTTLNVPTNDIALLKLDKPASFHKWIKPLCLPYNDEIPNDGQMCAISGWGETVVPDASDYPGILNEAALPVYSYNQCVRFPGYRQLLTRENICAGFKNGKVDACNLDSGGPLQCKFRNRWVISGLTSYGDAGGRGCGQPMRPGVYTSTVNFVEWIHQQIYEDYVDTFTRR